VAGSRDAQERDVMARRILVVDDSGTSIMMAKMILTQALFEVLTARDGAEGVQQAALHRPDLILLDVIMPRMDGFEALRQMRAQAETEKTPIVMVTTRGEENNVQKGYDCGCTDYICKPYDPVELLTKVKSYLA
jgi:DNA-binding response OmpR family regulator